MIVLVGFMGAGKTTIGYLLAEKLGLPFVDIDILVERREKVSINDIFSRSGEDAFREIEHKTIVETLSGPDAVVALGGGAVEHPGTRIALENATVVYLEVDYDEALLRIGHDSFRPMMANPRIREIYQRRLPYFSSVSKLTIRTVGRRPESIVMDIISMVTSPSDLPAGTRSVLVAPMGGAHQVHIGLGIISHIYKLIPAIPNCKRVVLVHNNLDNSTATLISKSLVNNGLEVLDILVPRGEKAKSFSIVEDVCEQLALISAHREDLLIAIGGESICYLAGFVASTYNRGINLVLVPTTLFAQADSAIGGKNGVNLSTGENMVGTIYQPLCVVSDQSDSVLHRDFEFKTGIAEMIKHAFIADEGLLNELDSRADEILSGERGSLVGPLYSSTQIKAAIVTADEREQGERIYLNYGHTFGHAFEQLIPASPDRHGYSISLGMMAAAYLSFELGRISQDLVDRHREILSKYGLPVKWEFSIDALDNVWHRNKKYRDGVRFILLDSIGEPLGGVRADKEIISSVIARLRF